MPISRLTLIAGMLTTIATIGGGQPKDTVRARRAPLACTAAARSLRDWGWSGRMSDPAATPLATIVSAVNYQLRVNSGQLSARDVSKLRAALVSDDPCVRELSLTILATQRDIGPSRRPIVRVAQNRMEKAGIRD
jgi:hypothetical protein